MMSQGMTLPAIARIIELQHQLAALTQERDHLAAQLAAHQHRLHPGNAEPGHAGQDGTQHGVQDGPHDTAP
ncbi:MAG: hypothetical protein JWN00_5628 [Actinomycetia bacterium]|nr:hypothetical protein [Actinomycetes bacterium]